MTEQVFLNSKEVVFIMMILKHYKGSMWVVDTKEQAEEIMNNVGGSFTLYKDITENDLVALKKFSLI